MVYSGRQGYPGHASPTHTQPGSLGSSQPATPMAMFWSHLEDLPPLYDVFSPLKNSPVAHSVVLLGPICRSHTHTKKSMDQNLSSKEPLGSLVIRVFSRRSQSTMGHLCFLFLFCFVFLGKQRPFRSTWASQYCGGGCGLLLECPSALRLFITTKGFRVLRISQAGGPFPGQGRAFRGKDAAYAELATEILPSLPHQDGPPGPSKEQNSLLTCSGLQNIQ